MQKAVSVQIPALEVIKDGILVYYVTCFFAKITKKTCKSYINVCEILDHAHIEGVDIIYC